MLARLVLAGRPDSSCADLGNREQTPTTTRAPTLPPPTPTPTPTTRPPTAPAFLQPRPLRRQSGSVDARGARLLRHSGNNVKPE